MGYPFPGSLGPDLDEEEIVEQPLPVGIEASRAPAMAPSEPYKIENPAVKDYISKLYGDKFSDEARQKLVEQNESDSSGPNWAAGLAALGTGLQGGNAAEAGSNFLKRQQAERDAKLTKFDEGRKGLVESQKLGMSLRDDAHSQEVQGRERDAGSMESKAAQAAALKMGVAPEVANSLTAERFKSMGPVYQKMYEIEQRGLDRADAREERRALFGMKRDEKAELRAEKKAEKDLGLAVPGYERTGEVLAKPEEAMKLRKATANAEQLVSKLDRLRTLVNKSGSFEYGGNDGSEMESLATEIQLLAKGDDMYQLGVLAGPDLKMLEKITSDPSSLNSLFTRDSTRKKQIDTQLKSVKDKLASVTKASGYRKAGGGESPKKEVVGRQRNKKTGEERVVYSDGTVEIVKKLAGM